MKLKQIELNEIFSEGEFITYEFVTLSAVETGEWEQDGKFQKANIIFTDGNKFYRGTLIRSGSPSTFWHWKDYGDADIEEVEKRIISTTTWVAI